MTKLFAHNNVVYHPKMIVLLLLFAFLQSVAGELVIDPSNTDEQLVKWAGYGDEKLSNVVVGGRVVCHVSNSYLPVSGATMSIACGASAKTKKAVARCSTDSSGDFQMEVPSHLHAIPNLEKICHVKVVRVPKASPCNNIKAFRGKNKRIQLISVGDGTRTYTTHSIHLKMHEQR